jgi:hypothetical protein
MTVIAPGVLNSALLAYVATVPNKENLAAHVALHEPAAERATITAEVQGVIGACEDFLYGYPGGVPWTEAFIEEYRAKVTDTYPWLDAASWQRLMAFSQWLCWREGLDLR